MRVAVANADASGVDAVDGTGFCLSVFLKQGLLECLVPNQDDEWERSRANYINTVAISTTHIDGEWSGDQ